MLTQHGKAAQRISKGDKQQKAAASISTTKVGSRLTRRKVGKLEFEISKKVKNCDGQRRAGDV